MRLDVDQESISETTLPAPGVPVWVRGQGYRCLAARDRDGRWHTYLNGLPIEEVLEILPFSQVINLPPKRGRQERCLGILWRPCSNVGGLADALLPRHFILGQVARDRTPA